MIFCICGCGKLDNNKTAISKNQKEGKMIKQLLGIDGNKYRLISVDDIAMLNMVVVISSS